MPPGRSARSSPRSPRSTSCGARIGTLARRVSELEEANLQIPTMIIENQRLAKLLKTKSSFDHKTVAASVIYSDSTGAERVITIDQGSDGGVFLDATVLSPGGALVGQVTEVGQQLRHGPVAQRHPLPGHRARHPDASDGRGQGQPVGSPGHGQRARHGRHRRGRHRGHRRRERRSRAQSQFPKDIVIGTIIEVHRDPASIVSTALVEPATDLDSLESVLVVTDFVPPPLPGATPTPAANASDDPARRGGDPGAHDAGARHPSANDTREPASYRVRLRGASAPDRTGPAATADKGSASGVASAVPRGAPWAHPSRDHAGMDRSASHTRACVP